MEDLYPPPQPPDSMLGWNDLGRAYDDRVCPPAVTVARMRPHLADLGITRIARQTGLDVTGIPCFSAIRPNAMSLAVSQGKGVDDHAAIASAVMEAAELAIAERPRPADWTGCADSLTEANAQWFDPRRMLPFGTSLDHTRSIGWVVGAGVFSRRPVWVPRDVIRMDGLTQDLNGVSQNSNGLASGNTALEARFHALCELIERDAMTLWSILPLTMQLDSALAVADIDDQIVAHLALEIERSGLRLRIFDATSEIDVPTMLALIGPEHAYSFLDIASGSGTHPNAARAAVRAITEAIQSRITTIAGARDDIPPTLYEDRDLGQLVEMMRCQPNRSPPVGLPGKHALEVSVDFLREHLEAASIAEPVEVSLGGDCYGISVLRLLSEELEDQESNANWRPGERAVRSLMEAA